MRLFYGPIVLGDVRTVVEVCLLHYYNCLACLSGELIVFPSVASTPVQSWEDEALMGMGVSVGRWDLGGGKFFAL